MPMRGVEEAFQGSRRFDVLDRLGTGGGGVVYRARDHQSGRQVALKLMRDREDLGRFQSHFGSLKQLTHPNLVQLYDLVEERGRMLLVMELVEGRELLHHVRNDVGFDELAVRACFGQLAQALQRLHTDRRLHRDVKPSNVRVTAEGRVVLLDLDFALPDLDGDRSPLHEGDLMLRPAGTAHYMAPEQAVSSDARAASDWYALGVVLYEALTGRLPYRGSDLDVLLAKQDGRPQPPREIDPKVPEDLNDLCLELLLPAVQDRPSGPAVLRRLGVTDGSPSLGVGMKRPLVGRERELAQLRLSFDRSRHEPRTVRFSGPVGVGKSTLVEAFLRQLERDVPDLLVLRSRCPRYPDRPHAALGEPLLQIAETLRNIRGSTDSVLHADAYPLLARAFPDAARGFDSNRPAQVHALPPDPVEQRFRCLEAYRSLLREVADARPLVWWFDDYQWADVDSQRLLSALVQGEHAPRMLVLLTEEPNASVDTHSEPVAHEQWTVGELSPVHVRAFLDGILEGTSLHKGALSSLHEREGNPFALAERIRHLSVFGTLPSTALNVSELIVQRMNALTRSARDLLDTVAAARDPISAELCLHASELSRTEFVRESGYLESAGLLRRFTQSGQDMLVAEHPLIAECAELELQGERRVEVHRRLVTALIARDQRAPGRLLRHQGESGSHAAAAQSAWLAAEQAHEALAFQRAAELFTLGASLEPTRPDETGHRKLRRMAEALGHAGWALQAAAVYREAAMGAKSADGLHMRQRAAEHLLRGAELDEGIAAVRELLSLTDEALPATRERSLWSMAARRAYLRLRGFRFRSLSEDQVAADDLRRVDILWTSGVQLSLVDVVRGGDFLTRGLLAALKTGEPHRVARALCTEAWMRGLDRNGTARSQDLLDTARELCTEHPSPYLDAHIRLARGIVAFGRFRLPECKSHCRDAEDIFRERCADAVWELTACQVFQLISLANTARYEEQSQKLERAIREARERGDLWGHSYFRSVGAMGVMLAHDRPEEALEQVHEGSRHWSKNPEFHFQHWVAMIAEIYIDLYMGRTSALSHLEKHWPVLKGVLMLRLPFARMVLHELRARANLLSALTLREGRYVQAAEADAAVLLRSDDEISRGFGHLAQANVARLRGNTGQVISALRAGLALLEGQGLDLWVFAGRLSLGRVWDTVEGRELRRQAETTLRERGVKNIARWHAMMMPAFADLKPA